LQRLWIAAGGDPALAPTMAAIAEQRESGGWSGAWNSTGATGLWQVEWPGSSPRGWSRERLFIPIQNARAAVLLSNNSSAGIAQNWAGDLGGLAVGPLRPSASLPPHAGSLGGAGAGGGGGGARTTAASQPGCIVGAPGFNVPLVGTIGRDCLFSTSQARALIGGLLLAAAAPAGMLGLVILAAAGFRATRAGAKAAGAAEAAGGMIAVLPGLEPAGMAVAATGSAQKRVARRKEAARAQEKAKRAQGQKSRAAAKPAPRGSPAADRAPTGE